MPDRASTSPPGILASFAWCASGFQLCISFNVATLCAADTALHFCFLVMESAFARGDVNPESKRLQFPLRHDLWTTRIVRAKAQFQIIGTYSFDANSFLGSTGKIFRNEAVS